MNIVNTARLSIRQLTEDDASVILSLLNSQGFLDNIGDRNVRTLEQAKAYIQAGPMASYHDFGFGLYLVELTQTGEAIGMCGLIKRPSLEHIDIGYALLPQFCGKGYASEATAAIMQYGKSLNLGPIVAIVSPHNHASKAVLMKLGLTFNRSLQLPGDGHEVELYS